MRRRRLLQCATALGVGATVGTGSTGAAPGATASVQDSTATEYVDELPDGPAVELEAVAGGLEKPLGVAVAEESADRRFVFDGVGVIYVHDDGLRDEPFLDVRDRMVPVQGTGDERGLLGLAFHPEFEANGRFYVRYSAPGRPGTPDGYSHTAVLAEFEATDDFEYGDPDSERTVLEVPQPQGNHNAGPIAFGPDGSLYVTLGDGGGAGDEDANHSDDWYDANAGGNAQSTDALPGSVLRLDVDAEPTEAPGPDPEAGDWRDDAGYAVPDDNPLVGADGRDELYAWGFRNPWGQLSFHGEDCYLADVGQDLAEEVDLVEAGGNYGWNVREGTLCFNTDDYRDPREDCPDETPEGDPLLDPIVELRHDRDADNVFGTAVVGGHVYEGGGELDGAYVFGNFSESYDQPQGMLLAAFPPGAETDAWSVQKLQIDSNEDGELGRWVLGFGADDDGLYVTGIDGDGEGFVDRIVPVDDENGDDPADQPADDPAADGDEPAGEDDPDTDEDDSSSDDDSISGFGFGAALAGLAGAGARFRSRVTEPSGSADSREG